MRLDFVDDMRHVLRAPPFFLRGTGTAPDSAAANAATEFSTRFTVLLELLRTCVGAFDHLAIISSALANADF